MTPEIKALIIIILGLIFCFGGYKAQKLLITITWFAIGYSLVGTFGSHFITNKDTLFIVELVVGFLLASLGFKLEKLALFITVAYLTYITISPFITGYSKEVNLIIQGVVSLLAGGAAVLLIKPILIVVTSISGAGIIYQYLPVIVNLDKQIILICAIVIAIFGIIVQFKSN